MSKFELKRRKHCPMCHEPFAEERLKKIQELVNEQANDEGLWCTNPQPEGCAPTTIGEAYVQQALRELHRVIEDE